MSEEGEMRKVQEECSTFCHQHSLAEENSQVVFGEGPIDAKIIMIGEAPGYHESITGRPFCGAAGKILDECLQKAGLKRERIYITNLLKLRPPKNRDPQLEEIQDFAIFLDRQIEIIQPEIICPLGNFASRYFLEKHGLGDKLMEGGKRLGISRFHGEVFTVQNLPQAIKIIPLYHPAVATYNPLMKSTLEKDFLKLKGIID